MARDRDDLNPWAVVAGTLALSMAGNAVHATLAHHPDVSSRTAVVVALVPPLLAAVALHQGLRVWRRPDRGLARWFVVALVGAVFIMAFTLSFTSLYGLTRAVGFAPRYAWMGPLIVDATTVGAVADAMTLAARSSRTAGEVPEGDETLDADPVALAAVLEAQARGEEPNATDCARAWAVHPSTARRRITRARRALAARTVREGAPEVP